MGLLAAFCAWFGCALWRGFVFWWLGFCALDALVFAISWLGSAQSCYGFAWVC